MSITLVQSVAFWHFLKGIKWSLIISLETILIIYLYIFHLLWWFCIIRIVCGTCICQCRKVPLIAQIFNTTQIIQSCRHNTRKKQQRPRTPLIQKKHASDGIWYYHLVFPVSRLEWNCMDLNCSICLICIIQLHLKWLQLSKLELCNPVFNYWRAEAQPTYMHTREFMNRIWHMNPTK